MISLTHSLLFLLYSSLTLCPWNSPKLLQSYGLCVNSYPLLDISVLPSQNFHISVFLSFVSQWYPQPANLKWSIIYCLSFAMFIFFTAHCDIRDIVSSHLCFFHSEEWPDSLRTLLPSPSSSIPYYYKPEKITLSEIWFQSIKWGQYFLVLLLWRRNESLLLKSLHSTPNIESFQ